MEKSIISLNELTGEEIRGLVKTAVDIKKNMTKFSTKLSGKTLFLLFQKTSTKTYPIRFSTFPFVSGSALRHTYIFKPISSMKEPKSRV